MAEEVGQEAGPELAGASEPRALPALQAAAVLLGCAVVHLLLAVLLTALEQRGNPPACYGLGWGCEPGPWTAGVLWLLFYVGPAVLVLLVVLLVSIALPRARTRRLVALGVAGVAVVSAVLGPIVLLLRG